jgi:hypothetical protein
MMGRRYEMLMPFSKKNALGSPFGACGSGKTKGKEQSKRRLATEI